VATIDAAVQSGRWIENGRFSIRSERDPDELYIVELYGEFDLSGEALVEDALRQAVESDAAEIIVDLSGIDFIDASGLHVLAEVCTRDREAARIRFLRGSEPVDRVFRLAQLDRVLPFAD
jgi:anti-sigma B factor antagonist